MKMRNERRKLQILRSFHVKVTIFLYIPAYVTYVKKKTRILKLQTDTHIGCLLAHLYNRKKFCAPVCDNLLNTSHCHYL